MAKQTIGIGSTANDGTGDTLRDAMDKVNDNFTELYPYVLSFDNDDLVSNVLTSSHGLGRRPAGISIYDASDMLVGAEIEATTTQIIIDFGGAITGTPWSLVAI